MPSLTTHALINEGWEAVRVWKLHPRLLHMGGPPWGGGWILQRKWRGTGTHTLPCPFTADCVESPSVQEENNVYFVYIASYCVITLPPRAHGLDLHDTEAVTLALCATDTRYIFYNCSLNYYLVLISAVNALFSARNSFSLFRFLPKPK